MILSICAVVVAAGLLGLRQAPNPERVAQPAPVVASQAESGAQARQQQPPPPLAVQIVQTPVQAESDARREAEARKHDAKDLEAQERAATAAEKQISPAWTAAILSFLGTCLLVWTVWETRKANGIAREHMTTDLRAWVVSTKVSSGVIGAIRFAGEDYPEGIGATLHLANRGRTPALQCNMWSDLKVVGVDDPVPEFVGTPNADRPAVVAPDGGISSSIKAIVGDDLDRFKARQSVAYLYGHVTYVTVFDPDQIRTSECCYCVAFEGYEQLPDGRIIPSISSTPTGPQNTAT